MYARLIVMLSLFASHVLGVEDVPKPEHPIASNRMYTNDEARKILHPEYVAAGSKPHAHADVEETVSRESKESL